MLDLDNCKECTCHEVKDSYEDIHCICCCCCCTGECMLYDLVEDEKDE